MLCHLHLKCNHSSVCDDIVSYQGEETEFRLIHNSSYIVFMYNMWHKESRQCLVGPLSFMSAAQTLFFTLHNFKAVFEWLIDHQDLDQSLCEHHEDMLGRACCRRPQISTPSKKKVDIEHSFVKGFNGWSIYSNVNQFTNKICAYWYFPCYNLNHLSIPEQVFE